MSSSNTFENLDLKSLEELILLRERLGILVSRTRISVRVNDLQAKEKEIAERKAQLAQGEMQLSELLNLKASIEEELSVVRSKLASCLANVTELSNQVGITKEGVTKMERVYSQQTELFAKLQCKAAEFSNVVANVDELIAIKSDIIPMSNDSMEELLADYDNFVGPDSNLSAVTFPTGPKCKTEPENDNPSMGMKTGPFELFGNEEDVLSSSDSEFNFKPTPRHPADRKKLMRMESSDADTWENSSSAKRPKSDLAHERATVREFLECHKHDVKSIFQQQHRKERHDNSNIVCARIASGIWRASEEDTKRFGLRHILGNNTNEQSFSVVLRQVRISQKLLDSTGAEDPVDCSFRDPRDACEVAEKLRTLYESMWEQPTA